MERLSGGVGSSATRVASSKTLKSFVCEYLRLAERVGFEPTCRLPDKTLSRRPRYDHFGTSPSEDFERSGPSIIPRRKERVGHKPGPGPRPGPFRRAEPRCLGNRFREIRQVIHQ